MGVQSQKRMGSKMAVVGCLMVVLAMAVNASDEESSTPPLVVKKVKGKKMCDKGWECKGLSIYCCNLTITDYFRTYQFEDLFGKRNTPVAHAVGFWDFRSFITAAALYQPLGFGTTGGRLTQMKEVAAFLGHVGSKTTCAHVRSIQPISSSPNAEVPPRHVPEKCPCGVHAEELINYDAGGYGVATGGPLAWGLCYNKEMSPSQDYCDDYYKYTYPCAPGAQYYGRGALPLYWNYNYGATGEALKVDLLNHPEYIEQNATLAFQAAIWRWMTPIKKGQPSSHDAFVGNWKPTKNDTLSKRLPGFGTTMNILYGDNVCGQGDVDSMNNIVSHYQYYLDLMGVGREEAGPHDVLTCAEQVSFNPSAPKSAPSS